MLDPSRLMEDLKETVEEIAKETSIVDHGRHVSRESLDNVGNTNGRDIKCSACGEPYENLYVVEDFSQEELNRFVVLGPQLDEDEFSESKSRIIGLKGCPSCS